MEVDELIKSETKLENILTFDYKVVKGTTTENFSKIVECDPGELTEIKIEYWILKGEELKLEIEKHLEQK